MRLYRVVGSGQKQRHPGCRARHPEWMLTESLRRTLHQLDAGSPRIGNIGDDDAGRFVPARRLIKLDTFRLDLLDEGGVVLDVEADVVEHATAGLGLRRIG